VGNCDVKPLVETGLKSKDTVLFENLCVHHMQRIRWLDPEADCPAGGTPHKDLHSE
jgi:hypothetical protein